MKTIMMWRTCWKIWLIIVYVTMGYLVALSFVCAETFTTSLPSDSKIPLKITMDERDGRYGKKTSFVKEKIAFTVDVNIPPGIFQYNKPSGPKGGEKFQLKTPLEEYIYRSKGCINLPRVQIEFLVESYYKKDHTCFALYFISSKVKRKLLPC